MLLALDIHFLNIVSSVIIFESDLAVMLLTGIVFPNNFGVEFYFPAEWNSLIPFTSRPLIAVKFMAGQVSDIRRLNHRRSTLLHLEHVVLGECARRHRALIKATESAISTQN